MDFKSLLNTTFIAPAHCYTPVYILHFPLGFLLEQLILVMDAPHSLLYLVYFMTFVFLCMLVDAFHAHNLPFLLAVKHKILFVKVALRYEGLIRSSWVISGSLIIALLRIVTSFTMPINNIWGLPFSPDIRESLRIRHLFKFPLCEFWLLWIIRNRLPQRTLIQLRTLHIHEQELIILLVNQVIDAMGQRTLLAHTTHYPKSLIERGRPFRFLDFVNAWQAEQMITDESCHSIRLLLTAAAIQTHYCVYCIFLGLRILSDTRQPRNYFFEKRLLC